jgi:hypothetical protein
MDAAGRLRLARGNKGTLFVLAKDVTPGERLLDAVASGDDEQARWKFCMDTAYFAETPYPAPFFWE